MPASIGKEQEPQVTIIAMLKELDDIEIGP
jgi:hypothetical protein